MRWVGLELEEQLSLTPCRLQTRWSMASLLLSALLQVLSTTALALSMVLRWEQLDTLCMALDCTLTTCGRRHGLCFLGLHCAEYLLVRMERVYRVAISTPCPPKVA